MNLTAFSPVWAHVWQSTAFAALMALLAWALRRNAARVRHGLWLAASIKFLIPFALFFRVGQHLDFLRPAAAPAAMERAQTLVLNLGIGEAIARRTVAPAAAAGTSTIEWMPLLLALIWGMGCALVIAKWTREWMRVRRLVRAARPVAIETGMDVRATVAPVEPGVFGIWRPVLLMPECMLERLSEAELRAVLAHEQSHVERRDNLVALVQMLVEAAFWFHPLVWWIAARLIEERERACDEAVLRQGNRPEAYAEGILKVCEFCIDAGAAGAACAAGVTGADLKRRIRGITANRAAEALGAGKRVALALAGMAAIAGPIALGMMDLPLVRAQSAAKGPVFEVASVKPSTSKEARMGGLQFLPGGRLSVKNVPLFFIIAQAYNVPFQGPGARISGKAEPLLREAFDIEATAEKSTIAKDKTVRDREATMRAMLRNLLAERFHLVVHSETKDMPVYAIVVGKNGLKLPKSALSEKQCEETEDPPPACHEFNGGMGRGLHAQAANIDDLAGWVANWADRPLVDRTGLTGLYKIETPGWAPVDAPRGDGSKAGEDGVPWSERPTLFTIFEQMGLKLEATHATIEKYVIDSVAPPVAN